MYARLFYNKKQDIFLASELGTEKVTKIHVWAIKLLVTNHWIALMSRRTFDQWTSVSIDSRSPASLGRQSLDRSATGTLGNCRSFGQLDARFKIVWSRRSLIDRCYDRWLPIVMSPKLIYKLFNYNLTFKMLFTHKIDTKKHILSLCDDANWW